MIDAIKKKKNYLYAIFLLVTIVGGVFLLGSKVFIPEPVPNMTKNYDKEISLGGYSILAKNAQFDTYTNTFSLDLSIEKKKEVKADISYIVYTLKNIKSEYYFTQTVEETDKKNQIVHIKSVLKDNHSMTVECRTLDEDNNLLSISIDIDSRDFTVIDTSNVVYVYVTPTPVPATPTPKEIPMDDVDIKVTPTPKPTPVPTTVATTVATTPPPPPSETPAPPPPETAPAAPAEPQPAAPAEPIPAA